MNSPPPTSDRDPTPVLIFDGVCNLCNANIDFMLRHDRGRTLRFATNQSAAGRHYIARGGKPTDNVSTFYLYEDGKLFDGSTAVLRSLRHLGFPYSMLAGLLIVPRFVRDRVYAFIAERRYRWFGKRATCRIPTAEESARFLP